MGLKTGLVAGLVAVGVSSQLMAATQVYTGVSNDFTATGGTASWNLATSTWNNDGDANQQFASQAYTYNSAYVNTWQKLTTTEEQRNEGIGGIVFHFQSATPQAMALNIASHYVFGNWAGRGIAIYYSDVNDWNSLSPMIGGTWDQQETNPNWSQVYYKTYWNDNTDTTTSSNVATTDGDFWLRVDLFTGSNSGGQGFLYLDSLSVTGTQAVPEVSSLSLLGCAAALLFKKRR